MRPRSVWTPERVEELRRLWVSGESASQIARRMGDVTRNAVISAVHRYNLPGITRKPKVSVRHTSRTPKSRKHVKDAPTQPPDGAQDKKDTLAPKRHKTFPEPLQCHYPYNSPGDLNYHVCQNQRQIESYCFSHYNLTHQTTV